ncbi:MAG: DNA recombination protein RmuC [Flavobacteriia bacterium]|jgi:DNA recombination protein RmuC
MELITLIIISLIATATAIFFFLKAKQNSDLGFKIQEDKEKIIFSLNEEIKQIRLQHDDEKKKAIVLETQLEVVKSQLLEYKENQSKTEIALKEQLELMGKEIVARGSQALRSENQLQLSQFLTPFKEKLEAFENEVKQSNQKETERYVNMETIIRGLTEQHSKMNNTAQNLADALRGSQKTQGDWGELALERILEMSGLEKGREYATQSNYKDEDDRNQRPDVIINLPENKHIIIDSKVSLVAFERSINANDDQEQKTQMAAHILSLKNHIKQLSEKNYIHLKGLDTPEFVLMFIPLESSFAWAMKEEPNLYQFAWEKKIVLVTPSTLLATLKTVESIWKQERQNRHAIDIADQAGKLYDKFVGFISDLENVGKKQKDAATAYDEAMKKLSTGAGNLITSTEKLVKMGAKAKKQLDGKYLENSED